MDENIRRHVTSIIEAADWLRDDIASNTSVDELVGSIALVMFRAQWALEAMGEAPATT